ncbi:MAG: sulfotransferase [Chromatiaceae bacterium]|nr:MAG: sulfotransferase [Chromatiaceae bacterium]
MHHLFWLSCKRFLILCWHSLTRSPDGTAPLTVRRVLVMLLFLPVFALVQGLHWLGFLLDDILFRGWRRVEIREPLFVLGVPRSGTTSLHQVLAQDPNLTTFRTWECLFAPSVTERRCWLALAALDRRLGRPAARLLGWLERRIFAGLDAVHPMGLMTPEEDYFALMPILSCFILALPFPAFTHIWRVGAGDRDLAADERRRLLDFYADCLRRHLYVHGPERRLLSKNAAFAPLAMGLAARFPDARFIVCLRDPQETVPSQLSSIRGGLAFFGVPADSAPVRARLLDQLAFYYENLDRLRCALPPERHAAIGMPDLRGGLAATLTGVYGQLRLPVVPAFAAALAAADGQARGYRSGHRYSLTEFGLTPAAIRNRFAGAYAHPALATGVSVAAARPLERAPAAPPPLSPPALSSAGVRGC